MPTREYFDKIAASNAQDFKREIKATNLYAAKVVDVKDPKKQGRIKVWIPALMMDSVDESQGIWAMPENNFFTGNSESQETGIDDCGSCLIPPKGSYVLIRFDEGDFNRPKYIAGLNLVDNPASIPVENTYGSEYWNKWTIIKTPKGRQILISDDPDDEGIIIRGKYKKRGKRNQTNDPRLPSDSAYIEIWEKAGQEYVIMKDQSGQFVLLDSANKEIRIKHASGSYIRFAASGDIYIQAANNIYLNSASASNETHL